MDFPKKGEGTDHRCIVYLKKTYESEAGEKPHRPTYQCCSELYRCSGKDVSVLSVKIAQMVTKTATRKLNIAV